MAYSRGKFQELNIGFGEGDPGAWIWGNTSWVNGDLGYEYRAESGFLLHVSTGISEALQTETPVWKTASGLINPPWSQGFVPPSSPHTLFYVAVALGYHFGGT